MVADLERSGMPRKQAVARVMKKFNRGERTVNTGIKWLRGRNTIAAAQNASTQDECENILRDKFSTEDTKEIIKELKELGFFAKQ